MDCTQYVQCTREANGMLVGYPVKCSSDSSLKYSQRTQSCGSNPCLEMPKYCIFKPGKIVAYQPYPNIYGKCPDNGSANNGNIPLAMCPGQYSFNERTGQCEPTCTQVGNIPSNEDCHAYYSCGQGFLTGFSIVLNNCPSGFGYNPATQLCDQAFNNCTNEAN
ncbi:uncharacterized protein LOC123300780 [Chrysoperla carnea]|uniref:uncharacterized protein LOC123300780 n=1 Tax=Chrysoperla carnea TaxID=189513 RepID=UPI001D065331|nr:uncharacterized protein LOC123300780 [Chrysoperla carnea]